MKLEATLGVECLCIEHLLHPGKNRNDSMSLLNQGVHFSAIDLYRAWNSIHKDKEMSKIYGIQGI